MPDAPNPVPVVVIEPAPVPPEGSPAELCQWARNGLRNAMEGMGRAGGGIKSYHIGTRGLEYAEPGKQVDIVAWWQRQVEYYCGIPAPPSSVTGQDTAFRVVMRDV